MTSTPHIETLTCADCSQQFTRERKRGVKPSRCPSCAQAFAESVKAVRVAGEPQKLHCESCGVDWERTPQRGKPPKRCDACRHQQIVPQRREVVNAVQSVTDDQDGDSSPRLVVHQGHYSMTRIKTDYPQIPVETVYKLEYIEKEITQGQRPDADVAALKHTWDRLEGSLARS